ncbi:MAG: response regulator [Desulfuromonadaceae bacterium]|nr:response regulator [Desulfuromonadaceae bacterium]MDD5106445.1 response regulator [Desulfuromonadaceae bacterium]
MNNQATVLVIDDIEQFRIYLKTVLEVCGYRVVTAEGGSKGLELFKQETPDLVLVDLLMPDMHGLDVIAEIHKMNCFVPIIVISGQGQLVDSIEATRRGACDYLIKPINKNDLDFSIGRCLERTRLLRENSMYRERLEQLVRSQTRELRESRARYRRLLESVTNYVYTVTVKDGKPLETIHRPGCERITGHSLKEFSADPGLWFRIIHKDDRPLVFGLAQHLLTNSHNHTIEHRILHKDGSIRWVTNTLVPSWNAQTILIPHKSISGTEVDYYDGVITDITRRKVAEEELRKQLDRVTSH